MMSLIFTDFYCRVCLLVWCVYSWGRPWSVCEVVFVPYLDAVVTVNVMRVLLFVLHVCMLRVCEGDGNADVGWMRCGCVDCRACGWYTWFKYCV